MTGGKLQDVCVPTCVFGSHKSTPLVDTKRSMCVCGYGGRRGDGEGRPVL